MSDLFGFFDKVNREDFDCIDGMTDEEVKKLSPYVLLAWMHGAVDNTHIHVMLTDMYCNEMVFSLSKHPRLLLKLFIAANGGIDSTRYKFIKPNSNGSDRSVRAVAAYYQAGYTEAQDYCRILSEDEIERITSIQEERG